MLKAFKAALRNFSKETRGTITIEAVIVIPLLIWAATATYTFFDVFKMQNTTYRANYTISDMLSRETTAIDENYADGLFRVFKYITGADDSNSWIRISVLNCLEDCADEDLRDLEFDWSHGVNDAVDLVDTDIPEIVDMIPLFSLGDRLILVETFVDYVPPFSENLTHFGAREMNTYVVTRPRFAPQLLWASSGGGGGSGDSDSPDG